MRTSSVRTTAIALLIALASAGAARAADPPPPGVSPEEYERRIKKLENSLKDLKRDTAVLQSDKDTRDKARPIAGWQDGFFIQSTDGNYKLKIGGYTHFDSRFFVDDNDRNDTSQFVFRRVRPDLSGTVAKYFDFRILPDFAGSSLVLQDAYVDAKYFPEIKVRFGKTKGPVGIERLQSATALAFIERGLPTNLVPNRDLGIMFFSDVFGAGAFSYQLGVFNGSRDGASTDTDLSDDKEFEGRVFAHPFKNTTLKPLRGLGLGISGSYGRQDGSASNTDLPTFRSSGQGAFFRYRTDTPSTAAGTTIADGVHYRYSPQGYYYFGPFSLLAEYVVSTQDVQKDQVSDTLTNDSWQVYAGWVLTGEDASYKGVVPANSFDPFARTWGAVQVSARYSELDIDNDAFDPTVTGVANSSFADPTRNASKAQNFTIGANWYLNKNIMLALNYDRTWFDGGEGTGDRDTEDVFLTRVQLVF